MAGIFENLIGTVDGVNRVFTTSSAYSPGSTAIFINGIIYSRTDSTHGWTETSPQNKTITFITAPEIGDVLSILYVDTIIPSDFFTVDEIITLVEDDSVSTTINLIEIKPYLEESVAVSSIISFDKFTHIENFDTIITSVEC